MKKRLLSILLISGLMISCLAADASTKYNQQIKYAISKYKVRNYTGCIQDLTPIVKKDPSNVVAYYYLANAYMQIGAKDKASENFEKVISLNSAPMLTSYSLQAKYCMNSGERCDYKRLNSSQTSEMAKNPEEYVKALFQKQEGTELDQEKVEIDRLIKGKYPNNIHPEANRVIIDTMLNKQKQDMNSTYNKSEAPTNDEIAEAVKVLARAGINPFQMNPGQQPINPAAYSQNNEYANLAMMFGNNQSQNNNNYMNMLPFVLQQAQQGGNKQMTAEMVQTMMMSQMMPDFNFDSKPKY